MSAQGEHPLSETSLSCRKGFLSIATVLFSFTFSQGQCLQAEK